MAPPDRPLRKDAAANREKLLDQAEISYARDGFGVSLHKIAESSGLGVATAYRHFPSDTDLLLALYGRFSARIDEVGALFLETSDPYEQVLLVIDTVIGFAVEHPISRAVAARVKRLHPEHVRVNKWVPTVVQALQQAKEQGLVRPDLEATDLALLAGMLADLSVIGEPERSLVLPRMRAYVLDAIRPDGQARSPLPSTPITPATLTDLTHRNRPTSAPDPGA